MKSYDFFVPGPLPGMNEMIAAAKVKLIPRGSRKRNCGTKYDQMKREWTEAVCRICEASNLPQMEKITVEFLWIEKARRRDPDNITAAKKFIFDGLTMAKVIKNDGWAEIGHGWDHRFAVDKKNPGVIVTIQAA